jgi:hypothetical protein
MSLENLSTAKLEALISLVKKRDELQAGIASVEAEIKKAIGSQDSAPEVVKATVKESKGRGKRKAAKIAPVAKTTKPKAAAPVAKQGKAVKSVGTGRRGALKDAILAELKAVGSKGIAVKDLSAKLGVKNQNVHVWFATTGKTIKGLKKTGAGVWSYAG